MRSGLRRLAAACGIVLLAAATASAQAPYPTRPITIVSPFPVGGTTDVVARAVGAAMEKTLGQPVVVSNRPGAAGAIGIKFVVSSPADGYTLALGSSTVTVIPQVTTPPPFTLEQLAPVALLTADPIVLAVRASGPWRTAKDLLDDARARPERVSFASSGVHGSSHLPMALLERLAGVKLMHVPFPGLGPAVTGILGGHVDAVAAPPGSVLPHLQSGTLRALGVFAKRRLPTIPDVPAFAELGYPAAESYQWTALFAPRGTPPSIVARLAEAAGAATRDREFAAVMERMRSLVEFKSSGDLHAFLDLEHRRAAALVKGGPLPASAPVASSPTVPPPVALLPAPPVTPPAAAPSRPAVAFGRYHALVIGNQAYRHLTPLRTPAADARAVAALLQTDFGYQGVRLLVDATRAEIVRALDDARRTLGEDDNLLIYYAGHGWLDREADRGYWLGVDAEPDTRANWLSNADVTDTLRAIRAKHVLVVADSCYSGSLVRDVGIRSLDAVDLARLARKRARTVLTSGGLEPVLDVGGGGHSVFARAFLDTLRGVPGATDFTSLFGALRRNVLLRAEQTPQYSDIRLSGHDGGDFIFVRSR